MPSITHTFTHTFAHTFAHTITHTIPRHSACSHEIFGASEFFAGNEKTEVLRN